MRRRRPLAGGVRGGRRAAGRARGHARVGARVRLARRPRGARPARVASGYEAAAAAPRGACASSARAHGSGASMAPPGRSRPRGRVGLGDVVAGGGDEGVLVHSVLDAPCPAPQRVAQAERGAPGRRRTRRSGRGPVARRTALDLLERPLPGLEVELGRWAGRDDERSAVDADSGGVACVERAVRVEEGDVVPRVAGRGEAVEPEHALADDVDVVGWDRGELAPERVERGP